MHAQGAAPGGDRDAAGSTGDARSIQQCVGCGERKSVCSGCGVCTDCRHTDRRHGLTTGEPCDLCAVRGCS